MNGPEYELETPKIKLENNIVIDQANISYSSMDALNGKGSETDSAEFMAEIKENNVSEDQICCPLYSPTEEIHPDDALKSLNMGMRYLTKESITDHNYTTFDDEREETNLGSTKFKSFIDLSQTKLYDDIKYDSTIASSEKNEFDNRTSEYSELDAKLIENIVEGNQKNKYISGLVERKSSNMSVSADNYTTFDDEREETNLGSTKFKSFIDLSQTQLYDDIKYDSNIASSEKKEFDNRASEYSELDAKLIENIVEDNQRNKYISGLVERKSPKMSVSAEENFKQEGISCGNSKNKSVESDFEQVKALTDGTLSLESTAEEIDASLSQHLIKLKSKLDLVNAECSYSNATADENYQQINHNVCTDQNMIKESATPNIDLQVEDILNLPSIYLGIISNNIEQHKYLKQEIIALRAQREAELDIDKILQTCLQDMIASFNVPGSKDSKLAESSLTQTNVNAIADATKMDGLKNAAKNEENNQTLQQQSPEIKQQNTTQYIEVNRKENGRAFNIEKQTSEALFKFKRTANKDDGRHAPQHLKLLHCHNRISNLETQVGQRYGKAIDLIEDILSEQRSQTHQMQSARNPSEGKKETARGQSGMEREECSKNEAIPAKIITGKEENAECLNESICEASAHPFEVVLKPWADVHGEGAEEAPRVWELYPNGLNNVSCYEGAMRKMTVPIDAELCVRRVKNELSSKDGTKMVEKVSDDSTFTGKKCMGFFSDIPDDSLNNNRINNEFLKPTIFAANEVKEANVTRVLESNPTNTGLTDNVPSHEDERMVENATINEILDDREPVKSDVTKMMGKVSNDGITTVDKCLEFLREVRDDLDKNIQINNKRLLKIEVPEPYEEGAAYAPSLFESIDTNASFIDDWSYENERISEVTTALVGESEPAKDEFLYKDLQKVSRRVSSDCEFTEAKCMQFLIDLRDVADNYSGLNQEKWLKSELGEFRIINVRLECVHMELRGILERTLEFLSSNFARKRDLKNELRKNIESVYAINLNLVKHLETITAKLRAIDDKIVLEGSHESTLINVIAEFLEEIDKIDKKTLEIRETTQLLDEVL